MSVTVLEKNGVPEVQVIDPPAPASVRRRSSALLWSALAVVMALGAYFRFADIGRFGFWTDEMMHVYAAKSILATGHPSVPFLGAYPRAAIVSQATAAMFRLFGESEAAARIPFAAVNVAFIGLAFFTLRRLFSTPIAFASAVVLAFSPFSIDMSRECRMYTISEALYFLTTALFLVGFERLRKGGRRPAFVAKLEDRFDVNIPYLIAAGVVYHISKQIHELQINFGITVAAYSIVMLIRTAWREGIERALKSKYAIVLYAGVLAFISLLIRNEEQIRRLMKRALTLEDWQVFKHYGASYYRWLLTDEYPALCFLFPAGAYALIRRYGKAGFFWVMSFVPLILIHSFVFNRKADRYVFYIFPFFVTVGVAAIDVLLPVFRDAWMRRVSLRPRWERVAVALVGLCGLYLFCHPWMREAELVHHRAKFADWKSLPADFRDQISATRVVTPNPREFMYYFGRYPDYYRMVEVNPKRQYEPGLLNNFIDFRQAIEGSPDSTFIGVDWNVYNPAFTTDAMRQYLNTKMVLVPHAGDPRILVYRRR